MLYIVDDNGREFSWHVNNKKVDRITIFEVVQIIADGDELTQIYNVCRNVPTSTNKTVEWYGDHAKFIVCAIGAM
jgi:hypothetical protein